MKLVLFAAIGVAAGPALAAGPFDGTWKADIKSATFTSPPDIYTVAGGKYGCPSCKPPVSLPADGGFHKLTGHPYFDEMAVKVINPHVIKFAQRKSGKLVYEETDTVSADGRVVTQISTDTTAAKPVAVTETEVRIGAPPKGVHLLNGRWNPKPATQVSTEGMVLMMKQVGNSLTVSSPIGTSYTATFGGPAVPMKGDIGNTMVQLKRLTPTSFQITSARGGKTIAISTFKVAGATGEYASTSITYGSKSTFKVNRQ